MRGWGTGLLSLSCFRGRSCLVPPFPSIPLLGNLGQTSFWARWSLFFFLPTEVLEHPGSRIQIHVAYASCPNLARIPASVLRDTQGSLFPITAASSPWNLQEKEGVNNASLASPESVDSEQMATKTSP